MSKLRQPRLTKWGILANISHMLKIRMQKVGRVHEPVFRLVLTDSRNATRSGKYLENLGSYDSRKGEKAEFKTDRVKYWLSKGAQATGTVHNLLVSKKVIEGKKINVLPKKRPIKKEGGEEKAVEASVNASTSTKEAETAVEETKPEVTDIA
jgi:small subunit ribosomal protein S16